MSTCGKCGQGGATPSAYDMLSGSRPTHYACMCRGGSGSSWWSSWDTPEDTAEPREPGPGENPAGWLLAVVTMLAFVGVVVALLAAVTGSSSVY